MLPKLIIFLVIFVGSVQGRCNLTSEPIELIDCLSFMTRLVIGIAKDDVTRVCKSAGDIAGCTRGYLRGCIGQEIGEAVLSEIMNITSSCCPDRNNAKCPYRDSILQNQRCFSADSLVTLHDGQHKTLAQLKSGDQLLAFDQHTRTVLPTRVITMLDYQPLRFALFKHITTVNGRQLSLSSSHLIFTPTADYVMAKDVREGMEIVVIDHKGDLVRERVSNVSEVIKQGYVAPLTDEGTIIVNDVAASCYSTINSHRVAHAVLSPMRLWYRWFGEEKISQETEEGVHWFPKMIYDITSFLLPSIIEN